MMSHMHILPLINTNSKSKVSYGPLVLIMNVCYVASRFILFASGGLRERQIRVYEASLDPL